MITLTAVLFIVGFVAIATLVATISIARTVRHTMTRVYNAGRVTGYAEGLLDERSGV